MRVFIPEPFPADILAEHHGGIQFVQGRQGERYSPSELITLLRDIDGVVITSRDRFDAAVLDSARNLKIISKAGSKPSSNVDLARAEQLGIRVVWTPASNAASVAEMTIMQMLLLLRGLDASRRHLRAGHWRTIEMVGGDLQGRTVGIVGLGAIGRRVAGLVHAFGAHVSYFDPYVTESGPALLGKKFDSLDDLLRSVDVLTLHCEMNEHTRHLINARTLALITRGGYLINNARGGLVDSCALLDALDEGWLAGAAIDVYESEPPDETGRRLIEHGRVVATPHIAAYTQESLSRECRLAVKGACDHLLAEAG